MRRTTLTLAALLALPAIANAAVIDGGDDSTALSSVNTPVTITATSNTGGGGHVVGASNFKDSYAGKVFYFDYGGTKATCTVASISTSVTWLGPKGTVTVSADGSKATVNLTSKLSPSYYLKGTISAAPSSLSYTGSVNTNYPSSATATLTLKLTGGTAELSANGGCRYNWYGVGYMQ